MAHDEYLADRIGQALNEEGVQFNTLKMMGGLGFMVNDKFCLGIFKGGIMARVDPENIEILVARPFCNIMESGKRKMKNYIYVHPEGYDLDEDLLFWVRECLKFNPKAKSSKKKK